MEKILEKAWEQRKSEIEDLLEETIDSGTTDREVLEIMKELLKSTRVRCSIEDYYKDKKD